MQCNTTNSPASSAFDRRASFFALVGYFALALALGGLLTCLGLFQTGLAAGISLGFFSAFTIGLVAASSSCIAVSGGLLLAVTAKYSENSPARAAGGKRLTPVLLFVAGRVFSYAVFGGVIGYIGKNIALSSTVSGILMLAAALIMLFLGLDMLRLLPKSIKKIIPQMPAFIARPIFHAKASGRTISTMLLGAGTFFLPCGFTQALQVYALSSGSFTAGAIVLGGFALGTAPALIGLGWFAGTWKGSSGRFFFRLAGAAVVILGLINISNAYNLIGLPAISFGAPAARVLSDAVPNDGQTQTVNMVIGVDGYSPDSFTLRAGMPTHWAIDATRASGCQMSIVSRQLNLQKFLTVGENTIDFTAPSESGIYKFSCPMGMYRGQFIVQ